MDERTTTPRHGRFRFGVFELDAGSLELRKHGRLVPIRPQPLKLLALLLAQPGELVSREDIQHALWDGNTFVDFEQGVNHAIRELRAGLGDVAESPRFIQTLPRRGYRFIAPVESTPSGEGPPLSGELASPPQQPTRWPWRTAVAGVTLACVAITFTVALAWRSTGNPGPSVHLVLSVRPFTTPEADSLSGVGLANAISSRLGGQQVLSIRLESTNAASAGTVNSTAARPPRVATHVLSGDVTRNGTEVSVLARLDELGKGTLWSERILVQAGDLYDVENVIAERVVDALQLRLAAVEQERLRRRYTRDAAAYEDYLRGRAALVTYTPDGARSAVHAFEVALARDPGYALARAGLAMAAADMYLRFAPATEVEAWGARAETEARAALDLDPDLAEAHLARAAVARKREFDWAATVESSRRALLLNPGLAQAHLLTAAAYYHLGYMDESRIAMERGLSLHGPDIVEPLRIEALIALFSGNFAPARARLEEVSRVSSQAIGDTYLALAYYYSGSADRGRTMLESLSAASSASTSARAGVALAAVLAAQRDIAGARAQLERVLRLDYRDHHVAYGFGAAYAQIGDDDQAFRWLRIAADTGFPCLPFFERDPLLEPIRHRPGYSELLAYVRSRRDEALSTAQP
jgi:DNA-binding winged helix-turn-helix (wHTH) protein/tetratricopeptide (TPR) repeat protein